MTSSAAPRIVLDTNVWLDLLWFRDPACATLRVALEAGDVVALCRDDCRAEWQRVLGYPGLAIDPADAGRLQSEFDRLITMCTTDQPALSTIALPRCGDPDDQKFLELARDGAATVLLSRDRQLLRLSRRLRREGLFAVIRPAEFATTVVAVRASR